MTEVLVWRRVASLFAFAVVVLSFRSRVVAQQPKLPKIGRLGAHSFVSVSDEERSGAKLFVAELSKLGYVAGKNITIEYRYADDNFDRLPMLADELVRQKLICFWRLRPLRP